MTDGIPEDGKIAVAAPSVAVRLVEAEPLCGLRVFTLPGLPEDQIYVVDIDALNDALNPFSSYREERNA